MNLSPPILCAERTSDMSAWCATAEFEDGQIIRMTRGSEFEAVHALACNLMRRSAYPLSDNQIEPLWHAIRQFEYISVGANVAYADLMVSLLEDLKIGSLATGTRTECRKALEGMFELLLAVQDLSKAVAQGLPSDPLTELASMKAEHSRAGLAAVAENLECSDIIREKDPQRPFGDLVADFHPDPHNFSADKLEDWVRKRERIWRPHWRKHAKSVARRLYYREANEQKLVQLVAECKAGGLKVANTNVADYSGG